MSSTHNSAVVPNSHHGLPLQGGQAVDDNPDSYKQGMRRLASGVTVIATEYKRGRFGLVSTGVLI